MHNKIKMFSQLKNEPIELLALRLHAHQKVNEAYTLISFEERDEAGYGVLANVAHDEITICQYGILTTLEQLDYQLMQSGVIVCDLFDAMEQYDLTNAWQQLSLRHQAYTNSGVFIRIPNGMSLDVRCYFVQDNSVVEDLIKSIVIVKGSGSCVNMNYENLSVGNMNNTYHLEIVEIDEIA